MLGEILFWFIWEANSFKSSNGFKVECLPLLLPYPPSLSLEFCKNLGCCCRDKYLLRERDGYEDGSIWA